MAEKFLMPKLSPTMEEGQISRWLKNEGDAFEANETLAEVDTDKATMEMTSLTGGTLLKILKNAGETAALGEAIAITGQAGEDISALLAEVSAGSAPSSSKPSVPVATAPPVEAVANPPKELAAAVPVSNGRILVSPIAARMASENGIDLKAISGTGPQGRIIKRDIETALASGGTPEKQASYSFTPSQVFGASAFREEPTSQMRRVIAERLGQSIGPIPTFYLTAEIEMDNALSLRKAINSTIPEEQKISVNDIIVKVAAASLLKHPFVNASYQDKSIKFYEDADIGVAVAIDEGLITPVIRSANKKGFVEISQEIKEKAARAKAKKLQPEEYTGATFSISNLGMFGIKEFTAIINPPEAAILAVGGATPTPVVREGQVVVRNIMNVTMSCDHRVIDGATGAKFLQTFKLMLENPALLLA
jgi:pyruvate dehydrogenase E2 component (dihydrolipoamide acetyltransferase)